MQVRFGCPECATEVVAHVDPDDGDLHEAVHVDRPGFLCATDPWELEAAALEAAVEKLEGLRDRAIDRKIERRQEEALP